MTAQPLCVDPLDSMSIEVTQGRVALGTYSYRFVHYTAVGIELRHTAAADETSISRLRKKAKCLCADVCHVTIISECVLH